MRQSIVCRAREVALRARLTRYVQHSCDSLRKSRREKRGTRSSAILLSTAVQVPGAFWAVAFLLLPENAGHRAAVERELVACRRRPPAPAAAGDSCGESARGGLACHGLAGGREDQPSNPVSSRGHVGLGEGAAQAAAPAAVPPAGLQAGTGSGLAPAGPSVRAPTPAAGAGQVLDVDSVLEVPPGRQIKCPSPICIGVMCQSRLLCPFLVLFRQRSPGCLSSEGVIGLLGCPTPSERLMPC